MVRIKFKNLKRSELAERIAIERISEALERFPKSRPRAVVVTLGMENSPEKAGPDVFTVRMEVLGGRYHGLVLEKSAEDLYVALATVSERLLERLNRYSDRVRVKALKQRREFAAIRRGQYSLKVEGEKT